MASKFTPTERFLKADPKFNNKTVSKFINCIMQDGKKTTAQRIFFDAMAIVQKKSKTEDPLKLFIQAVDNVKPVIEVRSTRVGGQNLQVPTEVKPKRRQSLAMRWMLEAVRSAKGKPMAERLATEILAAANRDGAAVTKKENVHKMAEANKAFAHFAW